MSNRYLDEVGFVVYKDSRDAVKRVHRELREHYAERAERLERTLRQAREAAEQAAAERADARTARLEQPAARRSPGAGPAASPSSRVAVGGGRASCAACGPSASVHSDHSTAGVGRRPARAGRADPRTGPRAAPRRAAGAHRRAAARRHRRQGQGRQVDAAQRARRREGRPDRRPGVHEGRHVVPQQPPLPRHRRGVGRRVQRAALPPHRGRAGDRPRHVPRRRPAVRRRGVADRPPARHHAHRHAGAGVDLRRHLDALAALPRQRRAGTRRGRRRHLPAAPPAPDGRLVPRGVQGQHHDHRRVRELDRRDLARRRDRLVADERDGRRREGRHALPPRPARALAVPGGRPGRRAHRPGRQHDARGRGAGPARHRRARAGAHDGAAAVRRPPGRRCRWRPGPTRRRAAGCSTVSGCSACASRSS